MEEFIQYIPKYLLKESGKVFYSGRNAFTGKKKVYLLGINPGGDPIAQANETVEWHNNLVLSQQPNWSSYIHESWRKNPPGEYYLQTRLLHLFEELNLNPYKVPSSNIIFRRTREAEHVEKNDTIWNDCWEFHEKVIEKLGIQAILCFGKDAGKIVCSKVGANNLIDIFKEKNKRKWATRAFNNKNGLVVIVATHPSRAKWDSEAADPTPFIKKILQERNII